MNNLRRLSVVLGFTSIVFILLFIGYEYSNILPGHCIFPMEMGLETQTLNYNFFSCTPFSDLETDWWGLTKLVNGNQIIEFHTQKFTYALILPIILFFILPSGIVYSSRWINKP